MNQETGVSPDTVATLAAGVGAALTALWSYYFAAIAGAATIIGAVRAAGRSIDLPTARALTIVLLLFAGLNGWSIWDNTQTLHNLVHYIATHSRTAVGGDTVNAEHRGAGDTDLVKIIDAVAPSSISLIAHPIGVAVILWWLWAGQHRHKSDSMNSPKAHRR